MVRVLDINDQLVQEIAIEKNQWRRPFRHLQQRFYTLLNIDNLAPNRHYQLNFFEVSNAQTTHLPLTQTEFDTLGHSLDDYSAG